MSTGKRASLASAANGGGKKKRVGTEEQQLVQWHEAGGGDFHLLSNDVLKELFSFFDFHSAVRTSQSCCRLKEIADGVLDKRYQEVLAGLEGENERSSQSDGPYCENGENQCTTTLRRGWSREYETRAHLQNMALGLCDEYKDASEESSDENVEFWFHHCLNGQAEDEEHYGGSALDFLGRAGRVESSDLLANFDDRRDETWFVEFDFRRRVTLANAARYIGWKTDRTSSQTFLMPEYTYRGEGWVHEKQEEGQPKYYENRRIYDEMRHMEFQNDMEQQNGHSNRMDAKGGSIFTVSQNAFYLLRKARRTSIQVSCLSDGCDSTDEFECCYSVSSIYFIMFELPGEGKIEWEFYYHRMAHS